MKNQKLLANLNGRSFKGNYHPKTKRLRTEPNQRIRQLLRSSIPLNTFEKEAKNDQKT